MAKLRHSIGRKNFRLVTGLRGTEWEVTIIKSGLSKNGRYYSAPMLERHYSKFEGVPCMLYTAGRQTTGEHFPPGLSPMFVGNKVGYFKNVLWDAHSGSIKGTLVIYEAEEELRSKLKQSYESGYESIGLSIDAEGDWREAIIDGIKCKDVLSIDTVNNVDLVTSPAAGGQLERLAASASKGKQMHFLQLLAARRMAGGKTWGDLVPAKDGLSETDRAKGILESVRDVALSHLDASDQSTVLGLATIQQVLTLVYGGKVQEAESIVTDWFTAHPDTDIKFPVKVEAKAPVQESVGTPTQTAPKIPTQAPIQTPASIPVPVSNNWTAEDARRLREDMEKFQQGLTKTSVLVPAVMQSTLPDHTKSYLVERINNTGTVDLPLVESWIKVEQQHVDRLTQSLGGGGGSGGLPGSYGRVSEMTVPQDTAVMAFEGFFLNENVVKGGVEIPRFMSPMDALVRIEGRKAWNDPEEMSRVVMECIGRAFPRMFGSTMPTQDGLFEKHQGQLKESWNDIRRRSPRLQESVTTATFPVAFGTAFNNVLQRSLKMDPRSEWKLLVSTFDNLKSLTNPVNFLKYGGIGAYPVVEEEGAYNDLNPSPTEDYETLSPSKRGGTITISWESIMDDRVGRLRNYPRDLAIAYNLTVSQQVMDHFESNGNMRDGFAWISSNHSNLVAGNPALSPQSLAAAKLLMSIQTRQDSGERLALRPRYLVVSTYLEDKAWELTTALNKVTATEDSTLPNVVKQKWNLEPIVSADLGLTSTTRYYWSLVADPRQGAETIAFSSLGGRMAPDIFVQSLNSTEGDAFSADIMTMKARTGFGTAKLEHRGVAGSRSAT